MDTKDGRENERATEPKGLAANSGMARAVALKYTPGEHTAPQVVAAGRGLVAQRILDRAREAGVPVHRDAALVQALSALEVGDVIPPELYQAVAEVLVFLLDLEREANGSLGREQPTQV